MLRALVCFFAVASAYEVPVSRRAILTRAISVAPLAVVAPAFADGDNLYLTAVPRKPIDQVKVEADYKAKGQDGKLVDEAGAAAPAKIALGDTKTVASTSAYSRVCLPSHARDPLRTRR